MEREQIGTTTEEPTLRELIAACGKTLDNPMLLFLIEEAQSPTAADTHIKFLGWPNDLAKKVRAAVRLKERVDPKTWHELTQARTRFAGRLFSYASEPVPIPGLERLRTINSLLLDDQEQNMQSWPFFLREFSFQETEGKWFNTYDGAGETRWYPTAHPLDEWRFRFALYPQGDAFSPKGEIEPLFKAAAPSGNFAIFPATSPIPISVFEYKDKPIEIWGTSVLAKPMPHDFGRKQSSFFKTVVVSHDLGENEFEEIQIAFPQDLRPEYQSFNNDLWGDSEL
jgi:hypothetical protein